MIEFFADSSSSVSQPMLAYVSIAILLPSNQEWWRLVRLTVPWLNESCPNVFCSRLRFQVARWKGKKKSKNRASFGLRSSYHMSKLHQPTYYHTLPLIILLAIARWLTDFLVFPPFQPWTFPALDSPRFRTNCRTLICHERRDRRRLRGTNGMFSASSISADRLLAWKSDNTVLAVCTASPA